MSELKKPLILQLETPLFLLHFLIVSSALPLTISRARALQPFSCLMIYRPSIHRLEIIARLAAFRYFSHKSSAFVKALKIHTHIGVDGEYDKRESGTIIPFPRFGPNTDVCLRRMKLFHLSRFRRLRGSPYVTFAPRERPTAAHVAFYY